MICAFSCIHLPAFWTLPLCPLLYSSFNNLGCHRTRIPVFFFVCWINPSLPYRCLTLSALHDSTSMDSLSTILLYSSSSLPWSYCNLWQPCVHQNGQYVAAATTSAITIDTFTTRSQDEKPRKEYFGTELNSLHLCWWAFTFLMTRKLSANTMNSVLRPLLLLSVFLFVLKCFDLTLLLEAALNVKYT